MILCCGEEALYSERRDEVGCLRTVWLSLSMMTMMAATISEDDLSDMIRVRLYYGY